MLLVLSPYELAARTLSASAALVLASGGQGVVTFLPGPFGERSPERAREAAERSPRFARLVESLRWTGPLWRSGILRTVEGSGSPFEEARRICHETSADSSRGPLGSFFDPAILEDEERFIEAASRDLLRGGADPGLCLALEGGLESFAANCGACFIRSRNGAGNGLAGQPGGGVGSGEGRSRASLPLPTGADGEDLLLWRHTLASELTEFRKAAEGLAFGENSGAADVAALSAASRQLTERARQHVKKAGTDYSAGKLVAATLSFGTGPTGSALEQAAAALVAIGPGLTRPARAKAGKTAQRASEPPAVQAPRPWEESRTAGTRPKVVRTIYVKQSPWDV